MVSSLEVIDYLKNNLSVRNYISMMVIGSRPAEMIAKSDLDVLFVIDDKNKDRFFDELTNVMKPFVLRNKSVIYSFFRGPIKYEKKGLIHLLVYTYGSNGEENKELFVNEHRTVLRSLIDSAEIVSGKSVKELLSGVDLGDNKIILKNKGRSLEKLEILKKEGYIDYPEWKKTANGWKMLRTKKKADKFLKDYLIAYYKKRAK